MPCFHFTSFPVLTTSRLLLRRLNGDDAPRIFALRSNALVNKYLDRPLARSIDDAFDFIKKINLGIDTNQWIYWAINCKDEERLAGTICLWNFSDEEGKAEIGYELLPQYYGQGIMQEAVPMIIRYAFETLKLRKIEACTLDQNIHSVRVLERNHFKRDLDAGSKPDGEKEGNEEIIYSLVNKSVSGN
jgi:ribosomal-protein-alanine N-acetyltransferase